METKIEYLVLAGFKVSFSFTASKDGSVTCDIRRNAWGDRDPIGPISCGFHRPTIVESFDAAWDECEPIARKINGYSVSQENRHRMTDTTVQK